MNESSVQYTGHRLIESCDSEAINNLYQYEGIPPVSIPSVVPFTTHEYLTLRNGSSSALAVYDKAVDQITRIEVAEPYGISPRNVEQKFAIHALMNRDVPLVTIQGKAGTGKTLLALASALEMRRFYRQIILCRPVVSLSNKEIGYLPGSAKEKVDPYMLPLYDNIGVIKDSLGHGSPEAKVIEKMREEGKLIVEPLAYMRGRSLVKKFMIVDEAQNLTPHEIKTIITRAGNGTKIVLTGDIEQIDHPRLCKHDNGLGHVLTRLKGEELYAHITLIKGERSALSELAADKL